MVKIRLIEPPKAEFLWVPALASIKIGETVKIPKNHAKSVSPMISREFKKAYPERKLKTDNKSNDKFLLITRLK